MSIVGNISNENLLSIAEDKSFLKDFIDYIRKYKGPSIDVISIMVILAEKKEDWALFLKVFIASRSQVSVPKDIILGCLRDFYRGASRSTSPFRYLSFEIVKEFKKIIDKVHVLEEKCKWEGKYKGYGDFFYLD